MVLFPTFSLTPFKTPERSSIGKGNTFARKIKGVQDKCGKNYREFHYELLPKQIQGSDPTPNNKAMHLMRC